MHQSLTGPESHNKEREIERNLVLGQSGYDASSKSLSTAFGFLSPTGPQ